MWRSRSLWLTTVLLASAVGIAAQDARLPPPFPRTNATALFENDRIRVWDIVWPKGQPTVLHRHIYDQVGTYYAAGGRVITTPDGTARTTDTPVGSLSTTRKGTTHIEEGNTEPPLRAVFVELKKDAPLGGEPAAVGAPAFPREGAKQVLDDDRVTAWDYTWPSNGQGPRYRAARETVVVFLGSGTLRVSGVNGPPTTEAVRAGSMRHMDRGAGESIEIVQGTPRAIVFQFK